MAYTRGVVVSFASPGYGGAFCQWVTLRSINGLPEAGIVPRWVFSVVFLLWLLLFLLFLVRRLHNTACFFSFFLSFVGCLFPFFLFFFLDFMNGMVMTSAVCLALLIRTIDFCRFLGR